MSVSFQEAPPVSRRKMWSLEQFERMGALGLFGDEKFELIEGEILPKMTQNPPHSSSLYITTKVMERVFSTGYMVRSQMPLILGQSKPEPDVCVVEGEFRAFLSQHPTTAVLVVEISDATLVDDRTVKAALYARAGIEDYWIVNLQDRVLEVFRQPGEMPSQPLGWGYRAITRHPEDQSIAPLAAPQQVIAIAELLL